MRVDVYLALLTAVGASFLLPVAARRLAPRPAVLTLVIGGVVAAVVWVGGVALLAASVIGRIGVAGYLGNWSADVFAARVPVPPAVGVLGVALLSGAAVAALLALRRLVHEVLRLYRLQRDVAPLRCGDVAVVDAPAPEAMALPGWRGSIVLTSSMLRALEPAERTVLLAHERSHLRGRHWLFRLLVRLAAALLPTLRPTVRQCDHALERWADEDAAAVVGDRRLVASAVARASLATNDAAHGLAVGFSDGSVTGRVEALLGDRPVSRWAALTLPAGVLAGASVAVTLAAANLEDLFELARHL